MIRRTIEDVEVTPAEVGEEWASASVSGQVAMLVAAAKTMDSWEAPFREPQLCWLAARLRTEPRAMAMVRDLVAFADAEQHKGDP